MNAININSNRFNGLGRSLISIRSIATILVVIAMLSPAGLTAQEKTVADSAKTEQVKKNFKVTFIELGSVRCIPCQKMQPIMKSIEKKYGDDVKVVFHDVWTTEGKPFADKYKVGAIPTQVFLDAKGKEFFRHVGYFPEKELEKILKTKGVDSRTN